MSQVHILGSDGNGLYNVVIHGATPAGNNAANVAWSAVRINAGIATTVMPVGTGAGQITTAEKATVEGGTVMEVVTTLRIDSGGGGGASIDSMANAAFLAARNAFQVQYNRFGATRG